MKELAEHILDIAKNSVAAGATRIDLTLTEDATGWLTIDIADNGCGMTPEFLAQVTDPFTTTRTTRKVGMGLPLYRMAAEQTGGGMTLRSALGKGTSVTARFQLNHLDCPPSGDLPQTVALLIQGNPNAEWQYRHTTPAGTARLFTAELRQILGEDISLAEPEIFLWIKGHLAEQEAQLKGAEQK